MRFTLRIYCFLRESISHNERGADNETVKKSLEFVAGSVCFTTNEVAPVGHSFGAWNVVKEATQTNPGEKERFCVQCNARETQVIPIAPSVSILNFRPNMTVDYRTTITFAARVSNPVDTAEIHWYLDGKDVGTGEQFTAKEVKKSFTVQAKLMCDGEILAESQIQTVEVKTAFIEKIIAFFKALFGKLPVLTQAYLGIEKR